MEGHIFGLGIRILCFLCLCILPVNRMSYPSSESIEICLWLFSVCAQAPLLNFGIVFLLRESLLKEKYINHARKYIWCGCVPSSTSTIDKVYPICVWQWSKFNWQEMSGWSKFNWQDRSDVCVAVFHLQETGYVWGGPSSIDKMLLIFPGWECSHPGGQYPDSDSNWLEFKPFLVSRLPLWNFFSSAIFSFCHCCQIERMIVCLHI